MKRDYHFSSMKHTKHEETSYIIDSALVESANKKAKMQWSSHAKVAIVGDSAVGKTSLLYRLSENKFTHRQPHTLGNTN